MNQWFVLCLLFRVLRSNEVVGGGGLWQSERHSRLDGRRELTSSKRRCESSYRHRIITPDPRNRAVIRPPISFGFLDPVTLDLVENLEHDVWIE